MRRVVALLPLLVFLFACDCESDATSESASEAASASDPASDPVSDPATEPADPAAILSGDPTPTTITVVSESAERRLDITFGPAAPFGFGVAGEAIPALALDQADSAQWPRGCDCPCDLEGGCPECEPPIPAHVTAGPGAPHTFEWNGRLRRYRGDPRGGVCFDTLSAAPGRYVVSVCTEDNALCATADVTLPASDGITLDLDDPAPAPVCPLNDDVLTRAAATALDHMDRAQVPEMIRRDCPTSAVCIPDDELANRIDPNATECIVYAVPTGNVLDVVVQTARTRYSHHLVADATRTKGITYPPR
jgi:hypothetical protein